MRQKQLIPAIVRDVLLRRQLLQEALRGRRNHHDVAHAQMVVRVRIHVVLVVALHDLQNVVVRLALAVRLVQRHDDREANVHKSVHQLVDVVLIVNRPANTQPIPRTTNPPALSDSCNARWPRSARAWFRSRRTATAASPPRSSAARSPGTPCTSG